MRAAARQPTVLPTRRQQQHALPCSRRRSRMPVAVSASLQSPFGIRLLHPVQVPDADTRPLLVFLPGTDGTGQAITPQLPQLLAAGYDVRTLYMPPDDRSDFESLTSQVLYLLAQTLAARPHGPHNVQVTLLAESFGGCLALRIAAAAPHLLKHLVLLNPATCYNQSLNGLSSLVSATNLLGLFPQDLYNTAQAVLLPLLVDIDRVGPEGAHALRSMIFMEPPPNFETAASQQADDDAEQQSVVTLASERRRLQATSGAAFTTSGPQQRLAARPGSPGVQAMLGALGMSSSGGGGSSGSGGWRSSSRGGARSGVFGPAAAANFRSNLLRAGNLPDRTLRGIDTPVLLISSAKDRMLPSLAEGARLARLLPKARRVILPDSGHAALLERGLNLAAVMHGAGVLPPSLKRAQHSTQAAGERPASTGVAAPAPAAAGSPATAGASSSKGGTRDTPKLLRVVRDEKALPNIMGQEGAQQPPRPATLLPQNPSIPTPATARSSSSSSQGASNTPAAASNSSGNGSQGAAPFSPGAAAGVTASLADSTAAAGGAAASPAAAAAAAAGNGSSSSSSSSAVGASRTGGVAPASSRRSRTTPEQDLAWDEWSQLLAPWRDLVSPVLLGQDHLQGLVGMQRPLLFVGNHQKLGLYDMPLLAYELYMRGYKVRGLAHPAHWSGPLGDFFAQFGAVPAGPMTAFKLLKANQQVLLYPGGAREVNKRMGEEYRLFWRDSPDFVRLAARCNAIIVPFAAVGADDAYDVMLEADELLEVPVLGNLVKAALQRFDPGLDPAEAALPLTRMPGLGLPTPVPIPNLQRLYFKILPPIDTATLGLDVKKDAQGWQDLYDGIKASVLGGIDDLLQVQAADEQRGVGARISKAFASWQPAFNITQSPPGSAGLEEVAAADAVRRGIALQQDSMTSLSSVSIDEL